MDNMIYENAFALINSGDRLEQMLKTINGYLFVVAAMMTLVLMMYLAWILPDMLFAALKYVLCRKPKNDGAAMVRNHQKFCIIFLSTLHDNPNQTLNDFWKTNRHLIRAI